MLRRDAVIKVLDFGLAKLTQAKAGLDSEALTKDLVNTGAGIIMGTARYMSPEQARGTDLDARTDIWSLGVVLYEMLAGRAPFAGETTADFISVLLQKEPQPLTTLAPQVPAELQHIVSKALRKDRDERYQTAKSLLVDLKTLQRNWTSPPSWNAAQRRTAKMLPLSTARKP
jgi:eukaryotic-like serine/threonine-protein kinase